MRVRPAEMATGTPNKWGDAMKFIYVFDEALKEELLSSGYCLVGEVNGKYIFENSKFLNFSADKSKYALTNVLCV